MTGQIRPGKQWLTFRVSQTRTLTSTSIYLFLRDLIYRTYLIYCIFFWKKGYARSTDVIKSCTSQARDTRKALPEGQEAHHDGTITSENQNERSGIDLIKSSCLETALFYHPWPHPEHGCAPPHCKRITYEKRSPSSGRLPHLLPPLYAPVRRAIMNDATSASRAYSASNPRPATCDTCGRRLRGHRDYSLDPNKKR